MTDGARERGKDQKCVTGKSRSKMLVKSVLAFEADRRRAKPNPSSRSILVYTVS